MLNYTRVFTGSVCANECKYCPHAKKESRSLHDIEAEFLKNPNRQGVELYGGDPLNRFDMSKVISDARALYRRVKIVTNGRALGKWEMALATEQAGATGYEIKLFGANPALHDSLTNRPGSFYESAQAIANLQALPSKPFVAVRVLVCRENQRGLADVARLAATLKADRLIFTPVDPSLSLIEASGAIKLAIETAITNRLWAMTEGIPFCVMGSYEVHVSEAFLPATAGKVKVSACDRCAYDEICAGVPEFLAETFSAEAEPIAQSQTQAIFIEDVRVLQDGGKAKSPAHNV